jgi:anti-anti-sigma regulatory factor
MLCFVLLRELVGGFVRELEHAWTTANSALGARELIVDISGLTHVDAAGRELLFRMR